MRMVDRHNLPTLVIDLAENRDQFLRLHVKTDRAVERISDRIDYQILYTAPGQQPAGFLLGV